MLKGKGNDNNNDDHRRANTEFLQQMLSAFELARQVEKLRADALEQAPMQEKPDQIASTDTKSIAEETTAAPSGRVTAVPPITTTISSADSTTTTQHSASTMKAAAPVSAFLSERSAIPPLERKASVLKREKVIAAGGALLKLWIKDCLRNGILQLLPRRTEDIQYLKQRMVDYEAPKLNMYLDRAWCCDAENGRLTYFKQLLRTYLLLSAFEKRQQLSPEWQGELSQLVGITPTPEEVRAANQKALSGTELEPETLWSVNDITITTRTHFYHQFICYSFDRQDFVSYHVSEQRCFHSFDEAIDNLEEIRPLLVPKGTIFKAKVYPYLGLPQLPRVLLEERQVLIEPQRGPAVKESALQGDSSLSSNPFLTAAKDSSTITNITKKRSAAPKNKAKLTLPQVLMTRLKVLPTLQAASEEMTRFFTTNPFADFCPLIIEHVNLANGNPYGERSGPWYLCDREGKARALAGEPEDLQRQVLATVFLAYGHEFTAVVFANDQHLVLAAIVYEGQFLSLPMPWLSTLDQEPLH